MLEKNSIVNLFRYLWKYSEGRKPWVIISFIFSLISDTIFLFIPVIIARIFNSIQFSANDPQFLYHIVYNFGLILLLSLGSWMFHGPARLIEQANAFHVRKKYREDMFNKVLAMPAEWHISHHSGDTIDKIHKAADNLFNFSAETFMISSALVRLVGSIIILLFFDWRSSLVAILISLFTIAIIALIDKKIKRQYDALYKLENNLASAIHDYISNIITIITLRLKERAAKEISYRDLKAYPLFKKNTATNELKWFFASFSIYFMTFIALSLNAYQTFKTTGVIIIGTLFTLYKYLENVGNVFYNFAWQYGEMIKWDATIRVAEIIEYDYKELFFPKAGKLTLPKKIRLPKDWHTLKINDLSFTYKENIEEFKKIKHIDNISITIGKNEKIAFIGESGSGKSTVLALMRGLFTPEKAIVHCDGKILKYGLAHIYDAITLIPQEPEIFNTTIKDNITMGIHGGRLRLEEAISTARFEKVIKRLPKGLETNVMEKGVSLSGGEKQRLALARGLFAASGSQFLLLDEPTSSVDSENELLIYKNIFKKFSNRTILASVHRLHLLELFDYIYFFRNGKIITEGTLMTLMEDREFKMLWQAYVNEKKNE